MCGRFARHRRQEAIAKFLGVEGELPDLDPSYNVAPTQDVLVVRADAAGKREMTVMRWGLIPFWAKDPSISAHTSNARAETLSEKPSFKHAFKARRCLIPADGFFEWSRSGKEKLPYYFHYKSDAPIVFAGLWDRWKDMEGKVIESCTIVTTMPNDLIRPLHNRMGAILLPEQFDMWLDPAITRTDLVSDMLCPYPLDDIVQFRVSKLVNNVRNNVPACIEREEEGFSLSA